MSTEPLSAEDRARLDAIYEAIDSLWPAVHGTERPAMGIRPEQALREVVRAAVDRLSERPPVDEGLRAALHDAVDRLKPDYLYTGSEVRAGMFRDVHKQIDAAFAAAPRPEGLDRCPCRFDADLASGGVCPSCGHRDHGRSGCLARLSQPTDAPEGGHPGFVGWDVNDDLDSQPTDAPEEPT